MKPIRVFIGYDKDETVTYHVLSHSIMRHAKEPISITPLILNQIPELRRGRDSKQSTDFAYSRFLVPYLCNYEGMAIFMDCDMLVRTDIKDIFRQSSLQNPPAPVSVVKHNYSPKETTKFLDRPQTSYPKKNWSSLMVFDCGQCRVLTPELVNTETGMFLHQFEWTERVGEMPLTWNHLVGEYHPKPDAKIVHFTNGSPCFARYSECEFSDEWHAEKNLMLDYNRRGEYQEKAA